MTLTRITLARRYYRRRLTLYSYTAYIPHGNIDFTVFIDQPAAWKSMPTLPATGQRQQGGWRGTQKSATTLKTFQISVITG
jgi:hypothetical protein